MYELFSQRKNNRLSNCQPLPLFLFSSCFLAAVLSKKKNKKNKN